MSVYKDSQGNWYCHFYYCDAQGARHQKMKRGFKLRRDALCYEKTYIEIHSDKPTITMDSLYKAYIADSRMRLKLSTRICKNSIISKHILPFFGNMRIVDITPSEVKAWQNSIMRERAYSDTYLRAINNQLSSLMSYAVKYYHLESNPMRQTLALGVARPAEIRFWTPYEFMKFDKAVSSMPLMQLSYRLLYWTGMREGELLALTKRDIDFPKGFISINKTYHRFQKKDIISSPKTSKSRRRVAIPSFLREALKSYTAQIHEDDRIFTYSSRKLLRVLYKFADISELPRIHVHDLRHSHASLLINEGCDNLSVSEHMGHERVSTTLDIYAHVFPEKERTIGEKLTNLYSDMTISYNFQGMCADQVNALPYGNSDIR